MIIKARTRTGIEDWDPTRTFADGGRADSEAWALYDHAEEVERTGVPIRVFLDPETGRVGDLNFATIRPFDVAHIQIDESLGIHAETGSQPYVLAWWVWWIDRSGPGKNPNRHLLVTNHDPIFIMADSGETIERLR